MRKYELLEDDTIEIDGRILYRIRSLRDFGDVKEGDLGGYVEHYRNLSHNCTCWVYDNAKVYGNAWVYEDAQICDNAEVYGNAQVRRNAKVYGRSKVYGNATISDNARVYDDARVYDNTRIHDNSEVYGRASVYGEAQVYGNAEIYGRAIVCDNVRILGNAKVFDEAKIYGKVRIDEHAMIYGKAKIYGYAKIYDSAIIHGNAEVGDDAMVCGNIEIFGNAKVYSYAFLRYGKLDTDIKEDIVKLIACSLNIYPNPITNTYIFFKRVNKLEDGVYASLYDKNFIYKDNEVVEVKDYDPDFTHSCSSGLHVALPFYQSSGDTLIAVEVHVNDIITCLADKVRCKRLKVLGEVKI